MRKPYFRASQACWYILHGGKQVRLGEDKEEAFQRWHELLRAEQPTAPDTEVSDLIADFMDWCEKHRSPGTYGWYRFFLISFVDSLGTMKLSVLKPHHVTRWLEQRKFTGNTGNGAVRAVTGCFNWAVRQGKLKENPIKGADRPAASPRESYIAPDQFKRLMASIKQSDPFYDFLMFLRLTGCRPQEARTAEARHFDGQSIVFPRVESKGKRRQRVIPLNDQALAIVRRLVLKSPSGPIFRNQRGNPWAKNSLNCRFRRLTRKLNFHCHAYALRSTYITDALIAGLDPVTLSRIVGHASLAMIQTIYAKVEMRADHMKAAAEKAVQGVA